MYTLTIKNNSPFIITTQQQVIDSGMEYKFPEPLGTQIITIPGFGDMAFIDIGDKKIVDSPLKQTWKALICYQGEEMIFGYEGGGQLTVEFNQLCRADVSSNGQLCLLKLPAFKQLTKE